MLLEQEGLGSSEVNDSFLALKSTDLLVFGGFSSFATTAGFSVSIVIGCSTAAGARGEITEV